MRHQARVASRDSPQHHEAIKEACQEGSKCDLVAAVPHEVSQHARTELPRGERHVVIAIAGKNQYLSVNRSRMMGTMLRIVVKRTPSSCVALTVTVQQRVRTFTPGIFDGQFGL